jgi:hypothetical protein
MNALCLLKRFVLLSLCSLCFGAGIFPQDGFHKITFTFDYDFRVTPACSKEITKACVQGFNFYDISQGIAKRVKLGSMPVPAEASGLVKGISATTEAMLFNSGRHMVAVAAQTADGVESDLSKCSTIVQIP